VNVDGSQLLTDLVLFLQCYVRLSDDQYLVIAVWIVHCHTWLAWTRTPYLNLNSATQECGKTLLLELLELVVPNAIFVMGCSAAVLPRAIHEEHPVLLIDEVDQLMTADKELWATILQTINSGYKKSGTRLVSETGKGGWTYKKLSTFCAKALSGISGLPPTTASRCISIFMERMKPDDRVVEIDEYVTEPEANELFGRCQVWSKAHLKQLRNARPKGLDELGHRQREVSRPLLAIADTVGNGWGERLRTALVKLFTPTAGVPDNNIRIQLLHDIEDIFGKRERISSAEVAKTLGENADAPWSSWGKSGKPISQSQVAKQLVNFRVTPKVQRNDDGTNLRGYDRAQFKDLWQRYPKPPEPSETDPSTTIPPSQTVTTVTTPINIDANAISRPSQESFCYGLENASNPHKQRAVTSVTVQSGGMEGVGIGMTCPVHQGNTTWWKHSDGNLVCQQCHPKPVRGRGNGAA
jgi:hypothetical protein